MVVSLLVVFLQVGFLSIGGGYATIPMIQEKVVLCHQWLTMKEFTDMITISQMTPGPLAVNTSTFVGLRIAGPLGAVAATFGCIISGFTISLLLYYFLQKHRQSPWINQGLCGLKAASVGLIASSAMTILGIAFFGGMVVEAGWLGMSWEQWSSFNITACLFFFVTLVLLRRFHWHPLMIMIASGVGGLLVYY